MKPTPQNTSTVNSTKYLTADGKELSRGDSVVTVKFKESQNPTKGPEDEQVWIVTTVCGDMVRAKALDAPMWRQAFFIAQMETIEFSFVKPRKAKSVGRAQRGSKEHQVSKNSSPSVPVERDKKDLGEPIS